ncbi:MAG TPA: dihydrodipicolinate reductase C-terminal domain-containing protein [Alphaproteobacteria bacterium]|nr:dihydrodipicolinate reductase C-terminal domain-containing protein [Alphaproteobacteria bacterium]
MTIAVFGGTGKMGKAVCLQADALGIKNSALGRNNLVDFFPLEIEVGLDFSHHDFLDLVLRMCLIKKIPLLTGVSTFEQTHLLALKDASMVIPVMVAPNTSIGVAIMQKALKILNEFKDLVQEVDVDIIDCHHNLKKDAPSGTAKALLETLCKDSFYNPFLCAGQRPKDVVGMSSLRQAHHPGTHSVSWCHKDESLELTHTCYSKEALAKGALKAAAWLKKQPAGFYTMADFIG